MATSSALRGRSVTGALGERLAEAYLSRSGWSVIERNVRSRSGEIDLVAREQETLVFVEVRTRSSVSFGTPEESVTPQKQRKMVSCALAYLQQHATAVASNSEWRIDLIAIVLDRGRLSSLHHYRHVIG